ncbi:hypothetical protein OH76DRAFT_1003183 [Lentinus brumalis]|uniref:Uncharacterized protein n=1 Tax=Lentinus brumalis TaxID=2498619 RepID=A0A371CYH8_9APHY|nr:hypothetical protein OH76DRAFT_1003183 [Polyporus brumalis]
MARMAPRPIGVERSPVVGVGLASGGLVACRVCAGLAGSQVPGFVRPARASPSHLPPATRWRLSRRLVYALRLGPRARCVLWTPVARQVDWMPRARRRSVTRQSARCHTRPRESRGCADERISPFAGTRPVVLVWPATDSSDLPGRLRRCPRPRPATRLVCDLQVRRTRPRASRLSDVPRVERRASAGVRAHPLSVLLLCCILSGWPPAVDEGALGAHVSAVY